MFDRAKTADNTHTADKINKQFVSNPIATNCDKISHDSIFEIVQKLDSCHDQSQREEKISEIANLITSMQEQELLKLMSNENEIIRSFAVRAYVDYSIDFSINNLKPMLKDQNESVRDSAVMALCYMNAEGVIDLLHEATKDKVNSIKMRAIAGIADIAGECSSKKAKEILQKFLNDKNAEIKQFVTDELSFLN